LNTIHWKPSASIRVLQQRAHIIRQIRSFFHAREYLEVETPIMARFGVTDRYLSNIQAEFRSVRYALQTSPEYHMKRLLAAGSGAIFQLARVFRDDELGRWHNPEFSLLEWYQLGVNHLTLLKEVDALLQMVLQCPPLIIKTYRDVFLDACQLDPFNASIDALKEKLRAFNLHDVLTQDEQDRDQYLFLLMTHVVEPSLAVVTSPVAVIDFPSSQAALAKVHQGVAERFEVYYRGIELANGFHELTDVSAQAARFDADVALRQTHGLPYTAPDIYLLAALEHGLPACSGVALGVDRLITLFLQKPSIADTLSFDFSRA
jgi:lysyl-tRNA synthetase class 2